MENHRCQIVCIPFLRTIHGKIYNWLEHECLLRLITFSEAEFHAVDAGPTQDESQDGSLIGGQKRTCIGAVRNRGQHRGGVRGQQRGSIRGQHLRVRRPVSHDEERRRQ